MDQINMEFNNIKKKKGIKFKTWDSLRNQSVVLLQHYKTSVGYKKRLFKAKFLHHFPNKLNTLVYFDCNIIRLNNSRLTSLELPHLNSPHRSAIFNGFIQPTGSKGKKQIVINLLTTSIEGINGTPLRRIYGLNINDWPSWAVESYFLSRVYVKLNYTPKFKLNPKNITYRLDKPLPKEYLLQLIKILRKVPTDLAHRRLDKYISLNKFSFSTPPKQTESLENKEIQKLLGEIFTI